MQAATDSQTIPFRADWALFLDIDGTIVDIAERPELVAVSSDLPMLLDDLGRGLGHAVALLSGRSLASIDRLFPKLRLAVSGVHGSEWRTLDGAVTKTSVAEGLTEIRVQLEAIAAAFPGLAVEDKARIVAVHYRARPELESMLREKVAALVGGAAGLTVMDGKMVIEIKPEDRDKGTAIREIMGKPPFLGRVPLFFGDDRSDEYGFAAVAALGGLGVRVGPPAETRAGRRLTSVAATRAWLRGLRAYLTNEAPR